MIDTIENSRIEFKVKLVDDLEETVIHDIISFRTDIYFYSNIYTLIKKLIFFKH